MRSRARIVSARPSRRTRTTSRSPKGSSSGASRSLHGRGRFGSAPAKSPGHSPRRFRVQRTGVAGCAPPAPARTLQALPRRPRSSGHPAASTPPPANIVVETPERTPLVSSLERYALAESYFPTDGHTAGSPLPVRSVSAARICSTTLLPLFSMRTCCPRSISPRVRIQGRATKESTTMASATSSSFTPGTYQPRSRPATSRPTMAEIPTTRARVPISSNPDHGTRSSKARRATGRPTKRNSGPRTAPKRFATERRRDSGAADSVRPVFSGAWSVIIIILLYSVRALRSLRSLREK